MDHRRVAVAGVDVGVLVQPAVQRAYQDGGEGRFTVGEPHLGGEEDPVRRFHPLGELLLSVDGHREAGNEDDQQNADTTTELGPLKAHDRTPSVLSSQDRARSVECHCLAINTP